MLSSQEDQRDRREALRNDLSLRRQQEQGSTFHAHAQSDADTPRGRFSAVSAAHVVGSTAVPNYPQASAPFQSDPVPDEPPLSYDNPALEEPSTVSPSASPVEAPGDAVVAPFSTVDVERAASPLSQSDDPTTEGPAPPSASPRALRGVVGSSPFRRIK